MAQSSPEESRFIWYWGWLRLLFGILQMTLSAIAVLLMFKNGLTVSTWVFVIGALRVSR